MTSTGLSGCDSVNKASHELSFPIYLRPGKSLLILGIVSAIGFAVIGVWSVVAAATNLDGSFKYPFETAVICAIFWGSWFATSIFLIATCVRATLTVTSTSISRRSLFRTKVVTISDVSCLKWRVWSFSGRAVIQTPATRISIDFDDYTSKERTVLITALRDLVSSDVQQNWDKFDKSMRGDSSLRDKPRETAWICLTSFLVTGVICGYCWSIQLGSRFLIGCLACIAAAIWYLVRIRRFDRDVNPTTHAEQ